MALKYLKNEIRWSHSCNPDWICN